jgi:hypothetical protein
MMIDNAWVEDQRLRIQESDVIGFMLQIASGRRVVSPVQLRACETLLKKVLPDVVASPAAAQELPNVEIRMDGPQFSTPEAWLAYVQSSGLDTRHDQPTIDSTGNVVSIRNPRST